jgi:hypothetical protein
MKHSFCINMFWFHVTMMDNRRGKDQHGDFWTLTGNKLVHEFGDYSVEMEEVWFHGSGYYTADQLSADAKEKYSFMKTIRPKPNKDK